MLLARVRMYTFESLNGRAEAPVTWGCLLCLAIVMKKLVRREVRHDFA